MKKDKTRRARDTTNRRKVEHIRIIAADHDVDRRRFYFDDVRLRHRALPEINRDDVDTRTTFMTIPMT